MAITSTSPHKYGVLPRGNIPPNTKTHPRQTSFGQLHALTDTCLLATLEFLDAVTLASLLQCSRYLYVFGHFDDLWRDLVLRKKTPVEWKTCWKDTYTKVPHTPIRMTGVYSDDLFRGWLCRSYNTDFLERARDNLPRLDARDDSSRE
eukprot:CAMPEP_0172507872 /NCGR_PEP_ID=MMETSP1066-20121228/207174_1 /TAXON_ID=671091 /ORGANISM="Coscinodiscus wailesii, Strain CCMP2513" /LENGTH=147 /DNA_ID=CAMNT_0013285583 /DNA_START=140 /DNA_END=580 /DNA_ORIENTATION=+